MHPTGMHSCWNNIFNVKVEDGSIVSILLTINNRGSLFSILITDNYDSFHMPSKFYHRTK